MTSGTPLPAAAGESQSTEAAERAMRKQDQVMLKSQARPTFFWIIVRIVFVCAETQRTRGLGAAACLP